MQKFFLALAFLLLPLTLSAEEARPCTMMWCQEGLTVHFENGGAMPPGKYEFEINADGKTTTCKASLPFKNCARRARCSGKGVTLMESGCALPPDQHFFRGLMMNTIPQHIYMRIRHESGRQFKFASATDRRCSYPNGPQCDKKQCCSSQMSVEMSWSE
jgi:hypothetical protein